jgi:hypothetical protein
VLSGIPLPGSEKNFEYFIIPSKVMSQNIIESHSKWKATPGVKGQEHKDTDLRMVILPPFISPFGNDVSGYKNRWELIEERLK